MHDLDDVHDQERFWEGVDAFLEQERRDRDDVPPDVETALADPTWCVLFANHVRFLDVTAAAALEHYLVTGELPVVVHTSLERHYREFEREIARDMPSG